MRISKKSLLVAISILILPLFCTAIERAPWFPKEFELQAKAAYLFENFQNVASSSGTFHRSQSNQFIDLSLGGAYYDWNSERQWEWYAEVEAVFNYNNRQHFGLDCLNIAGRYMLMDDVDLSDPISLIAGAFLTKATKPAVHNLGSFHHAQFEFGAFLSAGKELSCHEFWVWRGWGSLGLGIGDVGSPWLEASLQLEKNYRNMHSIKLSLEGLYGFGGNSLKACRHFKGYGPINHRSLDLCASYSYTFSWEGVISLAMAHRVFARNFPSNANMLMLSLNYPFSL